MAQFDRVFSRTSLSSVALFTAAISVGEGAHAQTDLCDYSESQFLNFVGGAAAGTAVTASVAGESIVIIAAQSALLVGVAPAVAPVVTVSAATAAAGYLTLKAWCARGAAKEQAVTWYQASVDTASSGIEIAVDAHGRAVGYTTRVFEGVAGVREKASGGLTDWLCRVTGDC
jgi:hypothetical protein